MSFELIRMPEPAKNTQIRGMRRAERLGFVLPPSEMVLRIMGANLSPPFIRCQQKVVCAIIQEKA